MADRIKRLCKRLIFAWMLWSTLLTGYEITKMQIPLSMYLYKEDAVAVLSAGQKKISPKQLNLDFSGDIDITQISEHSFEAVCNLFGMIPLTTMEVEVVEKQEVIPGGIAVGVYVQTDGIFVIGTGDVITERGIFESPAKNIVKTGDYITSFQGEEICTKQDLVKKLETFQGEELILGIRRNQEDLQVSIHPVYEEEQCFIGIWVRDDTQGIGTLTYVTEHKKFGALGHGISDTDSEILMEVETGKIYDCEIIGITKGQAGTPGKLSGKIIYNNAHVYGKVSGNLSGGIYGTANEQLLEAVENTSLPIALKQEVQEGEAVILSAVEGTVKEYTVEITKIYRGEADVQKGMEVKVTDERLLALTGGIVQGMSGSPIIQDGKLVGAVTHVLVNDPTTGYGIFIENMLNAAS